MSAIFMKQEVERARSAARQEAERAHAISNQYQNWLEIVSAAEY